MGLQQRVFVFIADKFRVFFLIFGCYVLWKNPTNKSLELSVAILYAFYLIALELSGLRRRKAFVWRMVRLNLDFLYLDFLILNHEEMKYYGTLLFLTSLITSVNYVRNRYYFACSALIAIHVLTVFVLLKNFDTNFFIFFVIALFVFSAILFSDEYRYNLSVEKIGLSQDFVSNIKSDATPDKMSKNMLWRVSSFAKSDIAALYLNSGEHGGPTFFPFSCIGIKADDELVYINQETGIAGQAIKNKKTIYIEERASSSKIYVPFRTGAKGTEAVLTIPIFDEKEIYGVLILEFLNPSPLTNIQVQAIEEFINLLAPIVREVTVEIEYSKYKFSLENRLRGQLLAIRKVAHDIRNYMNPFVELPEYILKHKPETWDKDHIVEMSKTLEKVTQDFESDLNKCLEGKDTFTPNFQVFTLEELRELISDVFKIRCRQKLIQLRIVLESGGSEKVTIDKTWFLAIIENALSNSAKAYKKKPEGFFEIKLRKLSPKNHHFMYKGFEFTITDHAGGIKQETADKISENQRGYMNEVGEGLNIIKRYTMEMNGRIKCTVLKDPPGTQLIFAVPEMNS